MARRPPGNVVAAVPLSVLHRLRDGVDGVVLPGHGGSAPALRSVSTRLAGLARRIERLAVMRQGEDPSTTVPGA